MHVICVYQPPSSPVEVFLDELENLIYSRYVHSASLMVVGDVNLNIWMDDVNSPTTDKTFGRFVIVPVKTSCVCQYAQKRTHSGDNG